MGRGRAGGVRGVGRGAGRVPWVPLHHRRCFTGACRTGGARGSSDGCRECCPMARLGADPHLPARRSLGSGLVLPGRRSASRPRFSTRRLSLCLRRPFNLVFRRQTPVEALEELYEAEPGIYPTGFIFHMSRCGSTLVSQMLAALPADIVVSEASVIDGALRAGFWDPSVTDAQRVAWLRGVIERVGQAAGLPRSNACSSSSIAGTRWISG